MTKMNTNAINGSDFNMEHIKVQSDAELESGATFLTDTQFDKICRTCLKQNHITPIIQLNYDGQSFSAILESCASIVVKKDDSLPQNICENCIYKTLNMYQYVLQCRQSELMLKAVLNNQEQRQTLQKVVDIDVIGIKHENYVENDTDSIENNPQSSSSSCSITKIDKLEQPELSEDKNTSEAACADSESKAFYITPEKLERKTKKSSGLSNNCYNCKVSYETLKELREHQSKVGHSKPRNHICSVCNKSLSSNYKLKTHMRTHTFEKPYECKICHLRFSFESNLKRHTKIHTGEKPHRCEQCGKGFIQATTLKNHMRTHTGETPYVCSYCGKASSHAANHRKHLLTHNGTERRTRKPRNVIATTKIEENTTNQQETQCSVCNKVLSSIPSLKMHLLIHGEKKYLCSMCGKGFCSKARLDSHFKVHTGVKPYACMHCDKSFSHLGSLNSHVLVHTGKKPVVCKVCGKGFTQSSHLRNHMRIHSGERPYVCSFCGKSFAVKGNLTVHKRTHTGETPYVCDICDKGFYDSSGMKKHRRGHGENVQISDDKVEDVNLE